MHCYAFFFPSSVFPSPHNLPYILHHLIEIVILLLLCPKFYNTSPLLRVVMRIITIFGFTCAFWNRVTWAAPTVAPRSNDSHPFVCASYLVEWSLNLQSWILPTLLIHQSSSFTFTNSLSAFCFWCSGLLVLKRASLIWECCRTRNDQLSSDASGDASMNGRNEWTISKIGHI